MAEKGLASGRFAIFKQGLILIVLAVALAVDLAADDLADSPVQKNIVLLP